MFVASAVAGAAVSYGLNKALNSGASNASQNAAQAVADNTGLSSSIAADQWNRYKDIYNPLESKVASSAMNYDTPEKYAQAAGDAQATNSEAFGKARGQLNRTPGLDPSSPGYAAAIAGLDSAEAASGAVGQNQARLNVGNTAFARQAGVMAGGKGVPAAAGAMLAQGNYANLGLSSLTNSIAGKNASAIGGIVSAVASPATAAGVKDWLSSGTGSDDLGQNGSGNYFPE